MIETNKVNMISNIFQYEKNFYKIVWLEALSENNDNPTTIIKLNLKKA